MLRGRVTARWISFRPPRSGADVLGRSARHELEGGRARGGSGDGVDDGGGVAAVLGAVGGVEGVGDRRVVGLDDPHVPLDAGGADAAFAAILGAAEPGGGA